MFTQTTLTLDEHAEALQDKLIETRRDFHMHPELSGEEERTAGIVADRLRELGLDVTTGVGGHGVIGLLKGDFEGPTIAWRADMDAFPSEEALDKPYKSQVSGVKHVCGHDVHTTIGLGIAEVLASRRNQLRGQVKFIFQPAEETAEGAKMVVEAGGLENPKPEAIFGLHVAPLSVGKVGSVSGMLLPGVTMFNVEYEENQLETDEIERITQESFNALFELCNLQMPNDPASLLNKTSMHNFSKEEMETFVLVFPHHPIKDEDKIAGFTGILRTATDELWAKTRHAIEVKLNQIFDATELNYVFQFPERMSLPATVNDTELEIQSREALQAALGEENLLLLDKPYPFNSEDFAVYQQYIPGVFYWLGVANPELGIVGLPHTPDFDIDEACMVVGVKAMSNLLLSYLD